MKTFKKIFENKWKGFSGFRSIWNLFEKYLKTNWKQFEEKKLKIFGNYLKNIWKTFEKYLKQFEKHICLRNVRKTLEKYLLKIWMKTFEKPGVHMHRKMLYSLIGESNLIVFIYVHSRHFDEVIHCFWISDDKNK